MALGLHEHFLYFIEDSSGRSYYVENGVLKNRNTLNPLANNPDGWSDIEFSFDTNFKYFWLSRTVSTPFKFVREGANILRQLVYTRGNGYSSDAYIRVVQKRPDIDLYALCYYGKLDFTTFKDEVGVSVTINTAEGGLKSFLDANDNITYDIVCSENAPNWIKILFDGVTLQDKYNYSFYKQDLPYLAQTIGCVFLNNEGDSVGIIHGDPLPEEITGDVGTTYFTTSANYVFKSQSAISVRIYGSITFDLRDGVDGGENPQLNAALFIRTSTLAQYNLLPLGLYNPKQTYSFDVTLNLAAEEKVFILYGTGQFVSVAQALESKFYFSFLNSNIPSTAYSIKPVDLGQAILDKMTGEPGKYIFKSDWLTANNHITTTCGDALRNTDRFSANSAIKEYYIATTFEEFFNAYSIVPMALRTHGNVLQMDPIDQLYGNRESIVVSLGEISKPSIAPLRERLVNTMSVGYPDQTYDQRSGKFEFNSETHWKLPTDAVKADLNIIGHYRADCFGIEFIRSTYTGKDSTDNEGDKTPFLVVVDPKNTVKYYYLEIAAGTTTTTFTPMLVNGTPDPDMAKRFQPGATFTLRTSKFNDGRYFINSVNGSDITVTWIGVDPHPIQAESTVVVVIFDNYTLLREPYSSITGVLDNTVYNVTISPKRRLLNWKAYLASLFFQQPQDMIVQTSAKKNNQLVTTLNGVTIIESAPVTVADLGAPMFLPYNLTFTVKVPFTFLETMSNIGNGVIHVTHEGKDIYLMSIGKMSMKPATNDAQDWQLIISPRTSLMTLLGLSEDNLIIRLMNNEFSLPFIQPLHWVVYDYKLNPAYHVKQPHQDYEENRFPLYPVAPSYYQKWQTTDTIPVFGYANGVAEVTLYLYDDCGNYVRSYPLNTLPSTAIASPNLIKYTSIPLADFEEGRYQLVLKSGTTPFAITRIDVKEDWKETLLIEYTNSTNKLGAFFTDLGWMQIRVEGIFGKPEYKSDMTVTIDDPHETVLLRGVPYESQNFTLGYMSGLPEWSRKKLEYITLCDNLKIENTGYIRGEDSNFEDEHFVGYPFSIYTIKLYKADNSYGIVISNVTGDEVNDNSIIVLVNPQGYGNDENVVSVTLNG